MGSNDVLGLVRRLCKRKKGGGGGGSILVIRLQHDFDAAPEHVTVVTRRSPHGAGIGTTLRLDLPPGRRRYT